MSKRGHWDTFDSILGDFKQNIIQSEEFTVRKYTLENCLTTKPRIYLMSKERLNPQDEWELPDILDMSTTSENIDLEDLSVDSSTDLVPRTDVVPLSDENNSVIVVENSEESSDVVPLSDENNSVIVVDNSEEGSDNSQTEDNQVPEDNTDLNSTAVYERQNSHDSSAGGSSLISPVTVRLPSVPQCMICSDRYSECFLDCGHILCYICAAELEERGSICHICRNKFNKVCRLFF